MKTSILVAAVFVLTSGFTTAPQSKKYKGKIHVEGKSLITITPKFENNTDEPIVVSYELQSKKTGAAGNSSSMSQQGQNRVDPHKEVTLSVSKINIQNGEKIHINLKIYQNNVLIAQDSLALNGDNL